MSSLGETYNIGIQDLRKLTQSIQLTYGVDFGHYAMSSLQRRVIRILPLYNFASIEELIVKVRSDKVFSPNLLKKLQ